MTRLIKVTSNLVSLRHMPLALVCTSTWLVVLATSDYPSSEWPVVAMVAYLTLWVTLMVFLKAMTCALGWLHRYVREVHEQLGTEVASNVKLGVVGNVVAGLLFLALLVVPVGLAVYLTTFTIAYMELPRLAAGIDTAGLLMLGVGGVPVLLFCTISFCVSASVSNQLRRRQVTRQETRQVFVLNGGQTTREKVYIGMPRRPIREEVSREFVQLRELVLFHLPKVTRSLAEKW